MKQEPVMTIGPEGLSRAAECLKVLAHPVRLRIVDILTGGQLPVNRIAELCQLPPHQTCEHLRLMLGHGLLASQRQGRSVIYRIIAPQLPGIMDCIRKNCAASTAAEHVSAPPKPV